MSKFIDRLEEIIEGAPARMGFGPARAEKTPGLALIVQVSGGDQAGVATATEVSPDGIIISGLTGPGQAAELKDTLSDTIWGIRTESLSTDDAKAYEKEGSGVLAFRLKGTSMGAVSSEDSATVLCIEADTDIVSISGNKVTFRVECNYADKNFDDSYKGYVTALVIAEVG